MKFEKINEIFKAYESDVLSAALVLSYSTVAAFITVLFFEKIPIQMYSLDLYIYAFLMPASFIAIFCFLWSGYVRKEKIYGPLLRWFASILLASCFILFWPSFTTLKLVIPKIQPFWFDRYLIEIDRWLHFGVEPWRIIHSTGLFNESAVFDFIYFKMWLCATTFGLLYIIYFDKDHRRRTHYIFLFVLTWVILGNILALIFSSAGPLYVERLNGNPAFRDLMSALVAAGYDKSGFFIVQNELWQNFTLDKQQFGSGISAFPSVHVGVACVTSLYMAERSRWLKAPALAFVILILAGSVFCGWHYAIDGYVSIVVVLAMHRVLRSLFEHSLRTGLAPPNVYTDAPDGVSVR